MRHSRIEDRSRDLALQKSSTYLGCVRVPINALEFPFPSSKLNAKVKHLTRVFQREGCDRANRRHALQGSISRDDLRGILRSSHIDVGAIQSSELPILLQVPPNVNILCAQGKSRIEALRKIECHDLWWPVELYVDLSKEAFEDLSICYDNELSQSDGYICWKIIESRGFDSITEGQWWAMLSKSKADIFSRILRHKKLMNGLIKVLKIPGMRDGLQLGIIPEMFASKMDEPISRYLSLIYETCLKLVGNTENLTLLDTTTVQMLELRAPGVSQRDYAFLHNAMSEGRLFPTLHDHSMRQSILGRLAGITYLIPTCHTLQQDSKYIRRCGRVLKTLILGEPKDSPGCKWATKQTIEEIAFSAYPSASDSWNCLDFFNNLKLLYTYVMRDIRALTREHCLLEENERLPAPLPYNSRAWASLAGRAISLGFWSPNIEALANTDADDAIARKALLEARDPLEFDYNSSQLESHISTIISIFRTAQRRTSAPALQAELTSAAGTERSRRCGRQYTNAYNLDKIYYTAQTLNAEAPVGPDVTSLFVWKSVFHAFWGRQPVRDPEDWFDSQMTTSTPSTDQGDFNITESTGISLPQVFQQTLDADVVLDTAPETPLETQHLHTEVDQTMEDLMSYFPLQNPVLQPSSLSLMPVPVNVTQANASGQLNMTTAGGQLDINTIDVYLQTDTGWSKAASPSPENAAETVQGLLKGDPRELYVFDEYERGIHLEDCANVGSIICLTPNYTGFNGMGPPEL